VAFNISGSVLWKRNVIYDYGEFFLIELSVPARCSTTDGSVCGCYSATLMVRVVGSPDRVNKSYLLVLEPKIGKEIWRVVRPSGTREESRRTFITQVPFQHNGRDELLVVGGDVLTDHDPDTGQELWRWGTWNPAELSHWRLVPFAVASGGVVLACASKGKPIYVISMGGNGVFTDDAIARTSFGSKVISSDVPTPAFADNALFILNKDRKMPVRVKPTTGKIKRQSKRLSGNAHYEESPFVADDNIPTLSTSAVAWSSMSPPAKR